MIAFVTSLAGAVYAYKILRHFDIDSKRAIFFSLFLTVASNWLLTAQVAWGGNCGSQSSTMIIRGMSVDEIKLKDFFKVVFTELRISLIISVTLAVVNGIRIWIMEGDLKIAVVVSVSIIFIVIISQFIGCTLPMLAKRCRLDPAVMAAPLITTIVDAASILVYFSIATRFFNI